MPAADPAMRLANEIADIRREIRSASRGSQARHRSLEVDGKTVSLPDVVRNSESANANADVALATANGKNSVTYSEDVPDAAVNPGEAVGDLWFQRVATANGVITGAWEWTGSAWEARTFGDEVLNSLTVSKLVTGEIAAGQRIIAGPANGTHAEMTSGGFRVFAKDAVDGVPNEVIRLGTDTNDFFAISDGNDNLLASIDEGGRASVTDLVVQQDPTVMGGKLFADHLWARPRGVVAFGIGTPDLAGISSETALFGCTFTSEPGRFYRITVTGIRFANSGGTGFGTGMIWLLRERGSNYEYGRGTIMGESIGGSFTSGKTIVREFWGGEFDNAVSRTVSFNAAPAGSSLHAQFDGGQPYTMTIEDLGPRPLHTGATYATPTPEPTRQTYTETVAASWSQCYTGSGGVMSNSGGRLYQGYDPSGYNGNQASLIGFPDLTARLSGATLSKAELFIYASHWYNNAGGTGVIGAHGLTSEPSTFSGAIDPGRIHSTDWPKPGGRLIDVTSWDWKGGSVRGIAVGPGPNTSTTYYGYFNGVGQSYFPELRITYTK